MLRIVSLRGPKLGLGDGRTCVGVVVVSVASALEKSAAMPAGISAMKKFELKYEEGNVCPNKSSF